MTTAIINNIITPYIYVPVLILGILCWFIYVRYFGPNRMSKSRNKRRGIVTLSSLLSHNRNGMNSHTDNIIDKYELEDYSDSFDNIAKKIETGLNHIRHSLNELSNAISYQDNVVLEINNIKRKYDTLVTDNKKQEESISWLRDNITIYRDKYSSLQDYITRYEDKYTSINKKLEELQNRFDEFVLQQETSTADKIEWIELLENRCNSTEDIQIVKNMALSLMAINKTSEHYHLLFKMLSIELGTTVLRLVNDYGIYDQFMKEVVPEAIKWLAIKKFGYLYYVPIVGGGFDSSKEEIIDKSKIGSKQYSVSKVICWGIEDAIEKGKMIEKSAIQVKPVI